MLILTRKVGEGFSIGEGVEISISEINGDKVRIAIDAPKDIRILRSELREAEEFNKAAIEETNINPAKAINQIAKQMDVIKKKKG